MLIISHPIIVFSIYTPAMKNNTPRVFYYHGAYYLHLEIEVTITP